MVDEYVPAPDMPGIYFPDMVILYGVKLNARHDYGEFDAGEQGRATLRMQLCRSRIPQPQVLYSIVLGYGYAFEGHCYRLDAKRIFIVTGVAAQPAVGCGFSPPSQIDTFPPPDPKKLEPGFSMWAIRSTEELLEVSLSYGNTKSLILDANLPGKRSPSSYAITASLAHRNGRLNRE